MYYIRIENDNFGFIVDGIHEILETDIKISDEEYNKFFELQSQGKQFRVKNVDGEGLFGILEEYIPEIEVSTEVTFEDKMINMFKAVLAGDMQTLAYELYPEDFKEEAATLEKDIIEDSTEIVEGIESL